MNRKRIGLYLRVSTGEQTIETQRMGLVAACEAWGWRIVGELMPGYGPRGVASTAYHPLSK